MLIKKSNTTEIYSVVFLREHLAIGKSTLVNVDSDTELVPRPQAEWKLSDRRESSRWMRTISTSHTL